MKVTSGLPPSLLAAIPTLHWSLGPSSTPPMHFQSLEEMKSVRLKQQNEAFDKFDFVRDIPGTLGNLFPVSTTSDPSDTTKERVHFGWISVSLILLGNGLTDECHNLVTPLSWPDDIHFAHGPSIYASVGSEARSYATYVHCLVHRKEAFHTGEFGMMGFQNANFWSNAVAKSPGGMELPHRELLARVAALASKYPNSSSVQKWCRDHNMIVHDGLFETRAVHELCLTVLKNKGSDAALQAFAEQVVESEIRILLSHALEKAGMRCVDKNAILGQVRSDEVIWDESGESVRVVDTNVALSAARKVSSAHLGNFQQGGSVVLRRVAEIISTTDSSMLAMAVGVGCRLLESPACRLRMESVIENEQQDATTIEVTVALETVSLGTEGGGDLAPGDIIARNVASRVCPVAPRVPGSIITYRLESTQETDPTATWVDPLFGSRGETPTSVLQWSKGTVF